MRVSVQDGLACGWLVSRLPGAGLVMVTIAKQTLRMVPGDQCTPHPEPMPLNGDVATDHLVYPNDFAPYKPRADVVVEATAHALAGPTRYLPVSFTVGALHKRMLVAGDRTWQRGLLGHAPGEPSPFTSLPLAWTRALGGPGDEANPTGCGRAGDRMPNLEWPDRLLRGPSDRVPPAGFGAIPADWAVRRARMGTYGPDYVKKHWPWFPPDFDFGHFQAAP